MAEIKKTNHDKVCRPIVKGRKMPVTGGLLVHPNVGQHTKPT